MDCPNSLIANRDAKKSVTDNRRHSYQFLFSINANYTLQFCRLVIGFC